MYKELNVKALSIIAAVLAGLSFFIPVVGVFTAMLAYTKKKV